MEYKDEETKSLKSFERYLRKTSEEDIPRCSSSDSESDEEKDIPECESSEDSYESEDVKNESEDVTNETEESSVETTKADNSMKTPDRGPKVCDKCHIAFPFESFLKHVTHSKDCLRHYGNQKIATMKKEHRAIAWKQYERNTKKSNADSDSEDDKNQDSEQIKCEGCGILFTIDKFYKHVSHAKKCLSVYGKDRWDEMKKKRRADVDRAKYMKAAKRIVPLKRSKEYSRAKANDSKVSVKTSKS